jgi:DnaJ-class molecular chaperone
MEEESITMIGYFASDEMDDRTGECCEHCGGSGEGARIDTPCDTCRGSGEC